MSCPDAEGPYFGNQVSPIRKWAFYAALAEFFLGLEPRATKLMSSSPHAWWTVTLMSSFFFAVLMAELFRITGQETPWSNRKHIIVLVIAFVLIISIRIAYFVHSDTYINFMYNLH